MPETPKSNTVWYTIDDSTILTRVVVMHTIILPEFGRYIIHRRVDWPPSPTAPPLITHEDIFRKIYVPQDQEFSPCETLPSESFSFKTSSQPRQPWYSGLVKLWKELAQKPNNSWH